MKHSASHTMEKQTWNYFLFVWIIDILRTLHEPTLTQMCNHRDLADIAQIFRFGFFSSSAHKHKKWLLTTLLMFPNPQTGITGMSQSMLLISPASDFKLWLIAVYWPQGKKSVAIEKQKSKCCHQAHKKHIYDYFFTTSLVKISWPTVKQAALTSQVSPVTY